jgi:lactate dehydrogenase-like 2-hydroxyacid dehydrogenase
MKISLLEPIGVSKEIIFNLADRLKNSGHEFTYYDKKTTDPDELIKRSLGQNIIMIANNPYPANVIEKLNDLKMISVAFTGIDHIATDICKNKGITICNSSGYSDETVAELVVGMTIDALRDIINSDYKTKHGGTNAGIVKSKFVCKLLLGTCGARGCSASLS